MRIHFETFLGADLPRPLPGSFKLTATGEKKYLETNRVHNQITSFGVLASPDGLNPNNNRKQ